MWWSDAARTARHPPAAARRRLLVALACAPGLLLAGGCGFRPLYAGPEGEAVAEELAAIEVRAPLTRLGRILENQLIDDLNPAGQRVAPRWRLDLSLRQSRRALAIQLDDSITRYDLTLAAFFTLRELADAAPADGAHVVDPADDTRPALPDPAELPPEGLPEAALEAAPEPATEPEPPGTLYRSAVRRVASYNVISDPFATLIAEQDAERRAAVEVSREIRTLLTLYFETAAT